MQLTHQNTNFKKRTFPITLVCDNVSNAPNIGSLFRIADAFGVDKLILCGEHIVLGRKIAKTSRTTEKVVNYEIQESASEVIERLKIEGYLIISLEITTASVPIHSHKFSADKPVVLVIGDESSGISETILNLSDAIIHIEMFGHNSSMNVVQATNIALYEMTKQFL